MSGFLANFLLFVMVYATAYSVTLVAPAFGELINTADGFAIKLGSSLEIATGNDHTYYWCA